MLDSSLGSTRSAPGGFTGLLPLLAAGGGVLVVLLVVATVTSVLRRHPRGPVVPRTPVQLYVPEPYQPRPQPHSRSQYSYPYGPLDQYRQDPPQ